MLNSVCQFEQPVVSEILNLMKSRNSACTKEFIGVLFDYSHSFPCGIKYILGRLIDWIVLPPPKEREKEKRKDRREKKCPNNRHLLQVQ